MALKRRSPKSEGSSSEVVYENLKNNGEYEGRLIYVADLGLQERSYKGEEKPPAQQISLGIEILGETVDIDGKATPRLLWTSPFNIFQQLTEKGKELEYYKVFNPSAEPDTDADWDSALGEPCNVIITHVEGRGANVGKTFDNIKSLTAIPTKYRKGVEEATLTPCIGDADDEDNEATKAMYGLARFVWDKRLKEEPVKAPQSTPAIDEDEEDDIPF